MLCGSAHFFSRAFTKRSIPAARNKKILFIRSGSTVAHSFLLIIYAISHTFSFCSSTLFRSICAICICIRLGLAIETTGEKKKRVHDESGTAPYGRWWYSPANSLRSLSVVAIIIITNIFFFRRFPQRAHRSHINAKRWQQRRPAAAAVAAVPVSSELWRRWWPRRILKFMLFKMFNGIACECVCESSRAFAIYFQEETTFFFFTAFWRCPLLVHSCFSLSRTSTVCDVRVCVLDVVVYVSFSPVLREHRHSNEIIS